MLAQMYRDAFMYYDGILDSQPEQWLVLLLKWSNRIQGGIGQPAAALPVIRLNLT